MLKAAYVAARCGPDWWSDLVPDHSRRRGGRARPHAYQPLYDGRRRRPVWPRQHGGPRRSACRTTTIRHPPATRIGRRRRSTYQFGDAVLPIRLDVTDRDAAFAAVTSAHEHFGQLDVVVHNAGCGRYGAVEKSSARTRSGISS
ncbi:SDR family oxidoreductase [Gordonia sp. NPDC003376]